MFSNSEWGDGEMVAGSQKEPEVEQGQSDEQRDGDQKQEGHDHGREEQNAEEPFTNGSVVLQNNNFARSEY